MIESGMILKQKEICLLPIPFSDLTSIKRRPVLILSNNNYNIQSQDLLVMAITSNLASRNNSVSVTQDDMETGFLKTSSLIRFDKIYSIDKQLIIKTFGEITSNKFEEILDNLFAFLKK